MSILYLRIKAIDNNGIITDYNIKDKFKDLTEMARWFAHSYNDKYESDYEELIAYQCLCKHDCYLSESFRFEGIRFEWYHRYLVLYDEQYDRFLDIRDYRSLIEKQITNSLTYTEYTLSLINERRKRIKNNQGRTHSKYHVGKHTKMFKWRIRGKITLNPYYDDELNQFDICCSLPFNIRSKLRERADRFESRYYKVENNWKNKKCRHQWQFHECKK